MAQERREMSCLGVNFIGDKLSYYINKRPFAGDQ